MECLNVLSSYIDARNGAAAVFFACLFAIVSIATISIIFGTLLYKKITKASTAAAEMSTRHESLDTGQLSVDINTDENIAYGCLQY